MKIKYFGLVFILTVSVFTFAEKFQYDGRRYHGEIRKEYSISDNGGLIMKNIRGDVKIVGEARDNILVAERYSISAYSESSAKKIFRDKRAKYILKGKTLLIEGSSDSRRYRSDFTIRIPSKFNLDISASGGDIVAETVTGVVDINTSGGDVDVIEITGKLNIHTSGGDISAIKCRKDITVNTSGGDIIMKKIIGNLYAKTSGGDITIDDLNGDGKVKTSGGDIYLTRIKGKRLEASTSGGDIDADFIDINVSLSTSGGDINVGKTKSDVHLRTSGGDIEIDEVGGSLDASNSGGDIYVKLVKGACNLHTSGGDIEIDAALHNVKATTSGGDILLSAAAGSIYAHTSGGDVEVRKVLHKAFKDNSIDLASSGGNIRIYLPDNIKADIFSRITVHNKWDKNQIRSDFPLDITKEIKGSKLIITGKGRINGGGDPVNLKTSSGNIIISRLLQ